MDRTIAINVNRLCKTYDSHKAVDDLSFSVYAGEIFGLLGPNGAGKSTTLRTLITLLHPTSGTATVMGHDTVRDADTVRTLIGYVPQERAIDRFLTGREHLQLLGALYAKHYLAEHPQFDLIVCGYFHRAFNIGLGARRIINTGPLLRHKADEADHHPHFYIYDTQNGKLEMVPVPHAAAEDVISREHLERERAYDQLVNQLRSPNSAAAANTDIQFSDTLHEVAAANPDKITPNLVRLLSTLTGVNLKEGTHPNGQQQKAAATRRSQPPGS